MDDAALHDHQDATLAELGLALARLRDELAWTTRELRVAQAASAAAEQEAAALRTELDALRESRTWRVGRAVLAPLRRLRGS